MWPGDGGLARLADDTMRTGMVIFDGGGGGAGRFRGGIGGTIFGAGPFGMGGSLWSTAPFSFIGDGDLEPLHEFPLEIAAGDSIRARISLAGFSKLSPIMQ